MHVKNILHLGVKELWSLARDPIMVLLIVYAFTLSIYSISTALPDSLSQAPIGIVDEDQSVLSQRIVNAFQAPWFKPPAIVSRE
jgi:ABC-2 type transport system permease protein